MSPATGHCINVACGACQLKTHGSFQAPSSVVVDKHSEGLDNIDHTATSCTVHYAPLTRLLG